MPKLTIVGAGSFVFARRLITDMLTFPALRDSTITLMDVNEDKLRVMEQLARRMVEQENTGARIESTTDLRAACEGADYVATAIRVGDSRHNTQIPDKYGISYGIGDTSGISGVFYFLYNAPAMLEIARTMESVCPDALLLNYTNPMTMLCWTINELTRVKYVGLCHSVQGTAMQLASYIQKPFEEIAYRVAGINHMAWFLDFCWQGQDAYPLLWEAMQKTEVYERDVVRWELMKYFGAFITESSIHNSEYNAYFRRTPELSERYLNEKMWGVSPKGWTREDRYAHWARQREAQDAENRRLAAGPEAIPVERSHEYFSRILNAMETNIPYVFNGNVQNHQLITNLPGECVVEVPIMVDGTGLHPCYIGALPPALAGYDRMNLNVIELAVRAFVDQDRKYVYQAAQMDPLVYSQLSLPDIRKMVDEMFVADQNLIAF